jgi:hypothetical protein
MNILLWIDEAHLREVVILDAISYFVRPAASIICKLVPTLFDPTLHETEEHCLCQRRHPDEYQGLLHKGQLAECLLPLLLLGKCGGDQATVDVVVRLMVQFSFMVSVTSNTKPEEKIYVVPAMLPDAPPAGMMLINL